MRAGQAQVQQASPKEGGSQGGHHVHLPVLQPRQGKPWILNPES